MENELTIAFAESMTCGLAAHQLSTMKGTADVFKGSIVCYNQDVKVSLFRIPKKIIEKHSAESAKVTMLLAKKLKSLLNADIYVSLTGLASAGGSETASKPVGTVFICIHYRKKFYRIRKKFYGTPLEIRKKACNSLYESVLKILR